jgi:hypothetical protein
MKKNAECRTYVPSTANVYPKNMITFRKISLHIKNLAGANLELGMEPDGMTGSAFKWRSIDGWHEFHSTLNWFVAIEIVMYMNSESNPFLTGSICH